MSSPELFLETACPSLSAELDLTQVDQIVEECGRGAENVIPILNAIQRHYNYLPREALRRVCELTEIRPADLVAISTFFKQFRHEPCGKHLIEVCHGTACHVKGSEQVEAVLRHRLGIPEGEDTDQSRQFTIQRVACVGCCTLAPVLRVDGLTYGLLTSNKVGQVLDDFARRGENGHEESFDTNRQAPPRAGEIRVGLGSCCVAKGSDRLFANLRSAAAKVGVPVRIKRVGCVGMCHRTPLVEVFQPERAPVLYAQVQPDDAEAIVLRHFQPPSLTRRFWRLISTSLDQLLTDESWEPVARYTIHVRDPAVSGFLGKQRRIATEGFGSLDPLDIEEYQDHGGFAALQSALRRGDRNAVIEEIRRSGLRGRGGAGFPTGEKWERVLGAQGERKFVICNGDEGDPGAFMDRMILESFPYRVIEGMAIAAFAVGAREGFLYIRTEYPLAIARVRQALAQAEANGFLGDNIQGSDFSFKLQVREGGGAFVCGEETALLESLEGKRPAPRMRPPYPAESGLWGCPTLINNVETFATVPWIMRHGAEQFAALGTASSRGTKVFALAGKVKRGGLIEVPMGITLREIVEEIGGGVPEGRTFKAVQVGGPSGGCVPAELADTPIDYESLQAVGAMMGSGGLVVLDDSDCMVDVARYFLRFTQAEACGQCSIGRIGTHRLLMLLDRLCEGKATAKDLQELHDLSLVVKRASLCGLCRTAPNPVLSTLRYFREEYEAHLEGRCPAGKCKALITYSINDRCNGCTLCAQNCPFEAIPLTPYHVHKINNEKCERCDICRQVCPENAVEVK